MATFSTQEVFTARKIALQKRNKIIQDFVDSGLIALSLVSIILNPLFGAYAAGLFLVFGLALLVTDIKKSIHDLLSNWFILILPIFCFASVAWSDFPSDTIRHGVQLLLTFVISILISKRLNPEYLYRVLIITYVVSLALSLLLERAPSGRALQGFFASKNQYADMLSILMLLCTSSFFLVKKRPIYNVAFFALFIFSFIMFLKAKSAGALMALIPTILFAFYIILIQKLNAEGKILINIFTILFVMITGVIIILNNNLIDGFLLHYLGKDSTLTGRTELWEYAFSRIKERPVLGLGYQAFWVPNNPPAEYFWAKFSIGNRGGFHFHNMYLSNAVEIGIVGVLYQSFLLYAGFFLNLRRTIMKINTINFFYTLMLFFIIIRTFVEVPVFNQFNIVSIIAIIAISYSFSVYNKENN